MCVLQFRTAVFIHLEGKKKKEQVECLVLCLVSAERIMSLDSMVICYLKVGQRARATK